MVGAVTLPDAGAVWWPLRGCAGVAIRVSVKPSMMLHGIIIPCLAVEHLETVWRLSGEVSRSPDNLQTHQRHARRHRHRPYGPASPEPVHLDAGTRGTAAGGDSPISLSRIVQHQPDPPLSISPFTPRPPPDFSTAAGQGLGWRREETRREVRETGSESNRDSVLFGRRDVAFSRAVSRGYVRLDNGTSRRVLGDSFP